jgi:hypothetical protein
MSERSPIQAQEGAPGGSGALTYAACGALGLAAGLGSYAAGIRSPIAALIVAWYATESLLLLSRALYPPPRKALLQVVLPRAAGTAIAFPVAYLLMSAWAKRIALGYLILIALEGAYRAAGRLAGWTAISAPPAGDAPAERDHAGRQLLGGRIAAAAVTVLLLVATLYAQGLHAVALDARVYADAFQPLGLYERLLDAAAGLLVDAARDQGGQARRAVDLLSEEELDAATRLALPEAWTEALLEQALASTFSWLEEDAPSSVPPVYAPVADLQHHLKLAVSYLFDRVAPRLPACAEGMSSEALCRPDDMSVAAFVAIHKPDALAMVDEPFTLVPAEIDFATAVTMSPRTFREPLALLSRAGEIAATADRVLLGSGWAALASYLLLLALSARSAREVLLWSGIALLGAGAGGWLLSWSTDARGTGSLPVRAIARAMPGGGGEVPDLLPLLATALGAVHARTWPVELASMAAGGLGIVVSMALPRRHGRWQLVPALRLAIAAVAALSLLWAAYLRIGERAYERAHAAYSDGQVRSALARYRVLLRAYPLGARRPFLSRAERDARACALAVEAADALHAGASDRAAASYEALLVGNPPVAVRDAAAQGLLAALQDGAAELRAGGVYERALDRLRLANEALGSRVVYEPMAGLYLEWGDALLADSDYEAATATYLRLRSDVASARQWQAAEERAADAYCVWQAALRDAGDEAGAAWVCDMLAEALPRMAEGCAGCRR